jgi:hypothetical protein
MDVFEGEAQAQSCMFEGSGWMCFETLRARQCCLRLSMWSCAGWVKWAT